MCGRKWRKEQKAILKSNPMNNSIAITQRNMLYKSPIDFLGKQRKNVPAKLREHFVVNDISFHIAVFVTPNVTDRGMKKI
jgi:hypothetical protein